MVKKVGLGYIKRHYRYHPREGETTSSIDMRGEGGIIVDAYLKLHQEDGSDFVVTLEATALDTKDEVCYNIQEKLLAWDGAAFALMGTAILFLMTLVREMSLIKMYGVNMVIAMLCGSFIVLFALYRLFFSRLRRYRYIYAVEQFKKYHANEQWIALADDVFEDKSDKYFVELKKQSVLNGIGLLTIDENNKPTIYITPAREDLFDNKRKSVELISLDDFTTGLTQSKYTKWLGSLSIDLSKFLPRSRNAGLFRFQKSYISQIVISLVSILAICGVFYRKYQEKPIDYVDEEEYKLEHQVTQTSTSREPLSYLVDSQFVVPYLEKVPRYTELEKDTIDWLEVSVVRKKSSKKNKKSSKGNPDILISIGKEEEWVEYSCERFYTFTDTKYIIEESRHVNLDMAAQRMEELERINYEASAMWMGCFFESQGYYAVFLGPILSSRNDAERELQFYNRRMNLKNPTRSLHIVALTTKTKKITIINAFYSKVYLCSQRRFSPPSR